MKTMRAEDLTATVESEQSSHGVGGDSLLRLNAGCLHGSQPMAKVKASAVWQAGLWERWPVENAWPAKLGIYEAAAYLRVSPDTIRRFLTVARDGKARLAHQRVGSVYRIRRADLDALGSVAGRT